MINFSDKENVNKLIDLEKLSLVSTLDIQKNLNKQILVFMKSFMNTIKISFDVNPEDKAFFYLNEANSALNKSNYNITILKNLLNDLNNINLNDDNLTKKIETYNQNFKNNFDMIFENTKTIEKFIYEISITDISESSNLLNTSDIKEQPETNSSVNNISPNIVENTLVISEMQKKIIFPYNMDNIQYILLSTTHQYDSIQDVIDKVYTKPINYYRFSSISRFKEAYKLVKYKEKGSTFKALSLAFELLGNYSLHPAIIASCKSLDELDVYLACLEDNSLNDFKFFKIIYEIPPVISKFAKNII